MREWIAIVDNDTDNLKATGHILTRENLKVSCLKSGDDLIRYLNGNHPDLILLAANMPDMDGYETLYQLRTLSYASDIPVIFFISDEDPATIEKGLLAGVTDFIRKPVVDNLLILRIATTIELNRLKADLAAEVDKRTQQLMDANERLNNLKAASNTDLLTGLLNKAASCDTVESLCKNSRGLLLLLNIDSFRLINDVHGREAGDKVLIKFAGILHGAFPQAKAIGRMGSDEFIIFCDKNSDENMVATATLLVNEHLIDYSNELLGDDMTVPIGASVGAVSIPEEGRDFLSLYQKADEALYKAKQTGHHGYCFYHSHIEPDPAKSRNN